MALFTIPLLLILFRKITFNKNIQKIFSYVGTHSLEIYILQYFFLPTTYSLDNSVMGGGKLFGINAIRERVSCYFMCYSY